MLSRFDCTRELRALVVSSLCALYTLRTRTSNRKKQADGPWHPPSALKAHGGAQWAPPPGGTRPATSARTPARSAPPRRAAPAAAHRGRFPQAGDPRAHRLQKGRKRNTPLLKHASLTPSDPTSISLPPTNDQSHGAVLVVVVANFPSLEDACRFL